MTKRKKIETALLFSFAVTVVLLSVFNVPFGKEIGRVAVKFGVNIFTVLPCAFVLIGLFEVWVKKETVEKHFGAASGPIGHLWALALAGTTVGGLYVAFPVAAALHRKGARLAVIFTYIGASAIVRIPMSVFEASFLGLKFTLIRLLFSIPLVILTAELFGRFLQKKNYMIQEE